MATRAVGSSARRAWRRAAAGLLACLLLGARGPGGRALAQTREAVSDEAWSEALLREAGRLRLERLGSQAPPGPDFPPALPASGVALGRLRSILEAGGAISKEDRPFVERWFPWFHAAGLVGRRPTEAEARLYGKWLPGLLERRDWVVGGERCFDYNCISWSVGVTSEQLWPGCSVAEFDALFRSRGYLPYEGPAPESAADVALWALDPGASLPSRSLASPRRRSRRRTGPARAA